MMPNQLSHASQCTYHCFMLMVPTGSGNRAELHGDTAQDIWRVSWEPGVVGEAGEGAGTIQSLPG